MKLTPLPGALSPQLIRNALARRDPQLKHALGPLFALAPPKQPKPRKTKENPNPQAPPPPYTEGDPCGATGFIWSSERGRFIFLEHDASRESAEQVLLRPAGFVGDLSGPIWPHAGPMSADELAEIICERLDS